MDPAWYASDNGFRSRELMERAHRPIVALARAARPRAVLDLGCGNGALVHAIGAVPYGIDTSADAIAHARLLMPAHAAHFVVGDMFEQALPAADLVILPLARLVDAGPGRSAGLRARLRAGDGRLVVYAYRKRRERSGGLPGLAERSGIELIDCDPDAAAGFGRFR